MIPINIRVEKRFIKEVEAFRKQGHYDRAALLREILERGFRQKYEEDVVSQYEKGALSMGEACSLLALDRWRFLDLLKSSHHYLNVSFEDYLGAH